MVALRRWSRSCASGTGRPGVGDRRFKEGCKDAAATRDSTFVHAPAERGVAPTTSRPRTPTGKKIVSAIDVWAK